MEESERDPEMEALLEEARYLKYIHGYKHLNRRFWITIGILVAVNLIVFPLIYLIVPRSGFRGEIFLFLSLMNLLGLPFFSSLVSIIIGLFPLWKARYTLRFYRLFLVFLISLQALMAILQLLLVIAMTR